jgi:selenocysteine lyase/cysteine desulfurase
MSPSAVSSLVVEPKSSEPIHSSKQALLATDVSVTSESFRHFEAAEMGRYRALAPAVDSGAVTHVNSGYQAVMNLHVKAALDQYLLEACSSPGPKGKWQTAAADAAEALARHIKVPTTSLAFTRDTTEGLNLFQRSIKFSPGDNVVVLEGEHPNHVYGWLALREQGLEVRRIPDAETKSDFANAATFAPYVDDKTVAIGISSVMFHSGQLNDVRDIASRFRPRGVHVLVDMTQHIGAAAINVTEWNISAAAFGTHKALGCPTGLGALYINPEVLGQLKETPPIVGAGAIANIQGDLIARPEVEYHQSTARYGHLNISLVSATALGASLALFDGDIGMKRLESHYRALGRELIKRLDALQVGVVGSRVASERAPHIYIVELLDPRWASHFKDEFVYVTPYRRGVRVSFGFYNSVRDVESFVASVERGIAKGLPKA